MARPKKTKIEVNDKKSLAELMQETYNDANNQMNQSQKVINNLDSWLSPANDSADDVAKINKEKVGALKIKDSAAKIKMDLARLQAEIIKNEGDKEKAAEEAEEGKVSNLDFKELRKVIEKGKNEENENNEGNE